MSCAAISPPSRRSTATQRLDPGHVPHEDAGHRRRTCGSSRRRLQSRACRSRPPLPFPAARLPALSGQGQGQGRTTLRSATSARTSSYSAGPSQPFDDLNDQLRPLKRWIRSPIRAFTPRPAASSARPSLRKSLGAESGASPSVTAISGGAPIGSGASSSVARKLAWLVFGGNLCSVPDTTRRRVFDVHVLADAICQSDRGRRSSPPTPRWKGWREAP